LNKMVRRKEVYMEEFNLEKYLSNGVENIVKSALKASLSNPKASIFIAQYAQASKKARTLRMKAKEKGEHIPPFLIASITSQCNLHCTGCYARSNHTCHDEIAKKQLSGEEWSRIFQEAKEMGIGFILLAGGEPLVRKDIIKAAGKNRSIIFPIFTNGTMIDDNYIELFTANRNLVPVLSIEGNEEKTDCRRGKGVYNKITQVMDKMEKNKIFYGVSVTVTKHNLAEVTSKTFLDMLYRIGCKLVFYIEYVPIDRETKELAFGDIERTYLTGELLTLRNNYNDMLFISFPGDEKKSGGCLAAGRGFFHINSHGGAEPCPFSPYSDTNLVDTSLREALHSPLFRKLQDKNILMDDHVGGCVLFEKEELVKGFLEEE
jgi:MoaA/NifB/PqqE/SkfB family radical SAM enzyme